MVIRRAYIIDIDSAARNNESYVRLLLKGRKRSFRMYMRYDPYFYIDAPESAIPELEHTTARMGNETIVPLKIEKCERNVFGEDKTILKVFCKLPQHVPVLRAEIPYQCYEFNIPFFKRFMIDFKLTPFSILKYEREGRLIKKIISSEPGEPKLSCLAFDIETYNPKGIPNPQEDPLIMISDAYESKSEVFTYKKIKKEFVRSLPEEKETIDAFVDAVSKFNPDVIFGYNSSSFDIPYLYTRAQANGTQFTVGRGARPVRKIKKGMLNGLKIDGRIHIDLYPIVRFFGFIGVIKAQRFTLEAISEEVLGRKKKMVKRMNIWEMWDKEGAELEELADYSLNDAKITLELGNRLLPIQMELASLTKMPLFDVSISTSGQLVESLLMQKASERGEIVPNKPNEGAVMERSANPIQGAFVKLPEPGIYENIAVLDFRGLYPSIIVSYNIDPFMVVNQKQGAKSHIPDAKDVHASPTGALFLKGKKGLIPATLEYLLDFRGELKKQLKKLKKDSPEYELLSARSQAVKIISNSFYGYLGYARSRWYNRDCAESTTAWGRKHIQDTIDAAEKAGFNVLYGDTDSVFLLYKDKQSVIDFVASINKTLPEKMELELEGFYTRGVFVSKKVVAKGAKKDEDVGAKKKYAMLGDDGRIKIRGFELVRRDWSQVAKDTQLKVLEAILKEGSKEKAVKIVREVVERLKSGKVPLEELAISTQLNKDPRKYAIVSPELSAAKKAAAKGIPISQGSMISYVITKSGKSISEKAEIIELAKDYDPDYYINNQILPSVMKILKELGYEEHDLKFGGKQGNLSSFF